jgi:hypothetical protein
MLCEQVVLVELHLFRNALLINKDAFSNGVGLFLAI